MRKFLSSFWGMFAVLFALVLMGANTPLLIGNADYPISWFNTVRLVLPWRQATELPNQRVRIETGNTNWLRNPGFESATISPWTTSGKPTISFPSASYEGAQALSISQTSGSGKYVQGCVTTTDQVGGTNLEMSVFVMGSTASGYQVCSVVDGVEKQCVTAPDNGNQYTQVTATAIAPTTVLADDNVCIRIKSTSSGAVGIYVDEAYLGPNRNIGTVAQATAVAHGRIAGTTNCTPTRSSTSLGDFSTDADCVGPTVVFNDTQYGVLQTTDANLPQFTVNNLAPGNYRVVIGSTHYTSSSGIGYEIAISDGSTSCTSLQAIASNAVHGTYTECLFSYSTQADRTFKLQASSSSGSVTIANDQARGPINFFLYRYPSQSEQVLRMNCSGAACGTNEFSAEISDTGTVSNENVEWINGNASVSDTSLFALTFNTNLFSAKPNCTAQVITSDVGGDEQITSLSSSGVSVRTSVGTTKAAKIFSIRCSRVGSDRVAANMPLIKGGVTSGSSGVMRIEKARVSGAGVVSDESSDFINGNCVVSGGGSEVKTCTFNASMWSSAPDCFALSIGGGVTFANASGYASTSSVAIATAQNSGGTASAITLFCIGPR